MKGKLEFDYRGKQKIIEYTLNIKGYGGLPMLTLKNDKNQHFPFVRDITIGWRPLINNLKWPSDFMDIIYPMFEEKYQETIK